MKHGIKHNDIIEKVSCSIFRIMVQENLTGNIIDESNKTLLLNDPDELDECVFMNSSMFKKSLEEHGKVCLKRKDYFL